MDQYAAVFGRLHLLILHLPIGLVIGIAALESLAILRRRGGGTVPPALLWLNAAVALVAVVSGLKLSQESGYGGTTLTIHLWLGIAVAVVAIAVAVVHSTLSADAPTGRVRGYRASLAGLLLLVILAGHYGGTMTHGEGFVLGPLGAGAGEMAAKTVDFSPLGPASEEGFVHVAPILAQSCASCHSGSNAKAGLSLQDFASLKRGSEIGEVVLSGTPADSELLRRITLPEGDPERMPPEGRRQLTEDQIEIVRAWVLGTGPQGSISTPTAAGGESALTALRATLAHAAAISDDSDLLWIDMSYAQPPLDELQIMDLLRPLATRIAELTLTGCAVTDDFGALAAEMPKLRRLVLHETPVTDALVATLAAHPGLEELVLTKSAVTNGSIEHLQAMPALKRVYLWGSKVTAEGAKRLAAEPALLTDLGEFAEARALLSELPPEFVDAGPKAGEKTGSLAPVNTLCPVSGTAVDPKYLIVHEGKVVGFCCNNCPQQFWADPAKFADKLKP